MFYMGIFGLGFQIILSYLKSAPLMGKFRERIKIPKFGTKNALFGHFRVRIFKNYCHM